MNGQVIPLKHLADICVSNVDKKEKADEIPVRLINYVDVYHGDRIIPELQLMAATASSRQVKAFRLNAGDVIITKDSESADDIGVPAFVERTASDMVCGYHLAILRPRPMKIDGRFLYWAINSDEARNQMESRATGVTRFGLRTDTINQIRLRVPSHQVQRNIVSYLDIWTAHIDALIYKKRRVMELLDERSQALHDEWYERLSSVYGLVRIRRLTHDIEQGWSPVCDSEPADHDEWGVIQTSAVSSGRFRVENNKRLPPTVERDTRWLLRDGDLLVTRGSGTRSKVGRACVASVGSRILTLSDLVYRVRLTQAYPGFVSAALQTSPVRAQIESSIRTDVGLTLKIRRDDLADVRIPAAPVGHHVSEAANLARYLQPLQDSKLRVEKQLALLAERRQALITTVMIGETPMSRVTA